MKHAITAGAIAVLALAACSEDEPLSGGSGQLAFVSDRDLGQDDIYIVNADRTGLVNLTNHLADDSWPAWSPDGSLLAFQSDRVVAAEQRVDLDVFVISATGSGLVQLTSDTTNEG